MPCLVCPGCAGPYPGPARSGITIHQEDAMRADKRYYVTADRSRVVEEGDEEAAILLAAEGDDISTEDARRYKLGRYAPDAEKDAPKTEQPAEAKAEEQPAEAKMVEGPPEHKARSRRSAEDK